MSLPFLVILVFIFVVIPLAIALPIWLCWGAAALFRKVRHKGR
jgi:hypothetical protein